MTARLVLATASLAALLATSPALAQEAVIGGVAPTLETPNLPDNDYDSDADDPAFWVHPTDLARTLVIASAKNGGIRVYDLQGNTIQTLDPQSTDSGEGRINNIDVAYGFALADGSTIDVAVASDRGLDIVRIFRIDGDSAAPLTDVTDLSVGRAFPMRPDPAEGPDIDNPLDDQHTVYGMGLWRNPADGVLYAVGTQRTDNRLGVFSLAANPDGTVKSTMVRDIRVPDVHAGQDLRIENEDDPLMDWNPQFEGVVVDKRNGVLYAGEEMVGIWRFDLTTGDTPDGPFYETRGSTASSFNNPDSTIARDVEGLTIYYGEGETAYLIASSQGSAHGDDAHPDAPWDDTFVVFDISTGDEPRLLGSFRVGANEAAGIDAVQESDGADVIPLALPGWPNGLFVTQDGYNDDLDGLSGEPEASNFKFVDWALIANAFSPPLAIAPTVGNPR
ncbi:MAG: phytase [Bauldia sp.]|nr:phytase [Bauldia sp.]